jgi:hypothetical protein
MTTKKKTVKKEEKEPVKKPNPYTGKIAIDKKTQGEYIIQITKQGYYKIGPDNFGSIQVAKNFYFIEEIGTIEPSSFNSL